ncbi:MAG: hypothetical protein ABI851_00115 [Saprospiraceae bacterium]
MKLFITFLMLSTSFISCIRQEPGDYKLRYNRPFTIEAGSSTLLTHVYVFNFISGWNNLLSANNLSINDISKVNIFNVSISPFLSNEISYNFIEEIKVFIYDPADRASKLQIGSAYPEPNEKSGILYLLPGIADIKDYVSLNQFNVEVEIRYRELLTSSTDHNLELEFDVYKK